MVVCEDSDRNSVSNREGALEIRREKQEHTFARRPKATINPANSKKSIGQCTKLAMKGKRKSKAKRIPMAAMTSV